MRDISWQIHTTIPTLLAGAALRRGDDGGLVDGERGGAAVLHRAVRRALWLLGLLGGQGEAGRQDGDREAQDEGHDMQGAPQRGSQDHLPGKHQGLRWRDRILFRDLLFH